MYFLNRTLGNLFMVNLVQKKSPCNQFCTPGPDSSKLMLDSVIHWLYHCTVEKYLGNQLCYPSHGDLSCGKCYLTFERQGPVGNRKKIKALFLSVNVFSMKALIADETAI